MMRFLLPILTALILSTQLTFAQQRDAWIQVEAHPSLANAQQSARNFSGQLRDVNGFSLGGGWYTVALGPYTEEEAQDILRNLRRNRLIPQDSYIASTSDFRSQFWPVGANILNQTSTTTVETTIVVEPEPQAEAAPEPEAADETPRQARASESKLTREQKAELQVALKWAGFYTSKIDAAFGRGTRAAMSDWQDTNGFEVTGVLTTRQRAELLRQYNSVLEGMDIRLVQDAGAGISMKQPTGVVTFEKYEAPFAHYAATGDIDARVLLISQAGDENTLAGLYDIMQTLAIVPETGPRTLEKNAFTLIGEGALTISHTQAWLKNGHVKGFTLIWPAGDEERRTRLLGEMQESFERTEGVLDPTAGANAVQSIDLVSGLEIRKPRVSSSGFYVDRSGTTLTTAQTVAGCRKITLDQDYEAEIVFNDEALGIAVLQPLDSLAPLSVATFQTAIPRLQSDVAVAGFSYGGVLGAPTLTFGQLADLRGLNGETELARLTLATLDGDAGGPVVDGRGAVLGMLLPAPTSGRQLPDGVSFAAGSEVLRDVLQQAGVTPDASEGGEQVPPEALSRKASGMTVLVSCWD